MHYSFPNAVYVLDIVNDPNTVERIFEQTFPGKFS
jgi:hypothetical protein